MLLNWKKLFKAFFLQIFNCSFIDFRKTRKFSIKRSINRNACIRISSQLINIIIIFFNLLNYFFFIYFFRFKKILKSTNKSVFFRLKKYNQINFYITYLNIHYGLKLHEQVYNLLLRC